MNSLDKLKIDQGTITFWTKENQINFNDGKITPLFTIAPTGGSIFVVKDADNKLKVFYVVLDKGRVDLEYDVSSLNPNDKHMIAFTWSLENRELVLYIDGQKVVSRSISF